MAIYPEEFYRRAEEEWRRRSKFIEGRRNGIAL